MSRILDNKSNGEPTTESNILAVKREEPSCYHKVNPDPYYDLQDTQELHYLFGK